MTQEADGNDEQVKRLLRQIRQSYAETPPVPAPLKWAGAILAGIMVAGSLGMAVWLVSTVSSMQVMLARMDERQMLSAASIDERLGRLEAREEGRQ